MRHERHAVDDVLGPAPQPQVALEDAEGHDPRVRCADPRDATGGELDLRDLVVKHGPYQRRHRRHGDRLLDSGAIATNPRGSVALNLAARATPLVP